MRDVVLDVSGVDRSRVDVDALESLLRAMWQEARDAWPGVDVDAVVWASALAERLGLEGPMLDAVRRVEGRDLYLVLGCVARQRAALEAFDLQLESLRPVLGRAGATPALIDDLLAQLRARLLVAPEGTPPKVLQYGARARLASWLRVAAMRDHGAHADRRHPEDDAELEALLVSTGDPELEELRQRFRSEFRGAFGAALRALDERDRAILRHHLLDRLSIDRIGALYDVHRSTAARWLVDIRGRLYGRTQEEFRVRLGLAAGEFDSLMAMVLSQLTYSVGRELS